MQTGSKTDTSTDTDRATCFESPPKKPTRAEHTRSRRRQGVSDGDHLSTRRQLSAHVEQLAQRLLQGELRLRQHDARGPAALIASDGRVFEDLSEHPQQGGGGGADLRRDAAAEGKGELLLRQGQNTASRSGESGTEAADSQNHLPASACSGEALVMRSVRSSQKQKTHPLDVFLNLRLQAPLLQSEARQRNHSVHRSSQLMGHQCEEPPLQKGEQRRRRAEADKGSRRALGNSTAHNAAHRQKEPMAPSPPARTCRRAASPSACRFASCLSRRVRWRWSASSLARSVVSSFTSSIVDLRPYVRGHRAIS